MTIQHLDLPNTGPRPLPPPPGPARAAVNVSGEVAFFALAFCFGKVKGFGEKPRKGGQACTNPAGPNYLKTSKNWTGSPGAAWEPGPFQWGDKLPPGPVVFPRLPERLISWIHTRADAAGQWRGT